ncbi:MAG: hypothetical protein FWG47_04185 [Propionibacteriaceae bacterium]|nr:hypothetical protein [Propionibacteriaceae bacterium]
MKIRPIMLTVAAAGLSLALAACTPAATPTPSDPPTNSESAPPATSAAPTAVTLTVWAPQEDQADANSWLPKQQAAFAAAHPEFTITWKNAVVSEGDAANTVQQDPAAAADVYLFANDQLGRLIQSNAIGTLSPDVEAQVKAANSDVMITSLTGPSGRLYGVPYTANTWFMYYNTDIFTADDVKNLDTMLAKGKVAFPLDTAWYIASWYLGNGATLFGADGTDEAAGINFAGDNATAVTKYLVELVKNKNFVNDANNAGLAGLQDGSIGAYFSGSWHVGDVSGALGDKYGAAQPPTFTLDGKEVQMLAFAGSKAAAFNPNSAAPQAASMFAAFLGSTQAQQDHFDMRGIIPSDSTLATNAAVAASPVAIAQMDTVNNASALQPTVAAMGNFWDPSQTFGRALLAGDVTAANAAEKTEQWNSSMAG